MAVCQLALKCNIENNRNKVTAQVFWMPDNDQQADRH